MGDVKARLLVEPLPNTLPSEKAETILNTLSDLSSEALVETVVGTLQEANGRQLSTH